MSSFVRFSRFGLLLAWLAQLAAGVGDDLPADWPQFRGVRGDGISPQTGLLENWPAAGPPVVWSREIGSGYSSFAVVAGRAYTQMQTAFGQFVVCLDSETGETIWEHRYDWPFEGGGLYPGPRATPTLAGDQLFYAGPDGQIGCLTARDGSPVWSVNAVKKYHGRGTEFGYSCSPVWIDGLIIVPVGGPEAGVVAFNAATGETVWAAGNEPASYSTPLPITFADRALVVSLMQNSVVVIDVKTGELVWKQSLSRGYDEHASAPLYSEPRLLMTSPFRGGASQWEFTCEAGRLTSKPSWFSRELSNDVAASVLSRGFVYGFDLRDIQSKLHRPSRGTFRCLDWLTGKTQWSTDLVGQASIIVAGGKLILFTDRGEVILAEENPAKYIELARTRVFGDEICWTAPALAHGRLFLRTHRRAVCLDLRQTARTTTQQPEAGRRVADIATAERWDLQQLIGGEREAPFDLPTRAELRLWFVASLAVIGVAAAIASVHGLVCRGPDHRNHRRVVLYLALFVLGLIAGPFANRWHAEYVLTWPLSLVVAFQTAINTTFWAESQLNRRRARWISRAVIVSFLVLCVGYLLLCQRLGMVMESVFLLGFGPAVPVALVAAWRTEHKQCAQWEIVAWIVWVFAAFFGGTAICLSWRVLTFGPE